MRLTSLIVVSVASPALAAPRPASSSLPGSQKKHGKSTLTYSATKTIQVNTTITGHETLYPPYTVTRPQTFPYGSAVYTGTVTSTYTEFSTVTSTKRPASTARAPTVPGFVPILSESFYTDDIVIETVIVTSTSTSTYDPSPTTSPGLPVFVFANSTFTGYYTTDYVVQASTTVTVTETTEPPTYTEYAACRADNFASRIPTGQQVNEVGEYSPYGYFPYTALNAYDCCQACQGGEHGQCFGGGWEEKPYHGTCFLFTLEPDYPNATETCTPANAYGLFSTDPYAIGEYGFVAFNGPCGQLDWEFQPDIYV